MCKRLLYSTHPISPDLLILNETRVGVCNIMSHRAPFILVQSLRCLRSLRQSALHIVNTQIQVPPREQRLKNNSQQRGGGERKKEGGVWTDMDGWREEQGCKGGRDRGEGGMERLR